MYSQLGATRRLRESTVKKMVGKTIELGRIPTAEDLAEGGSCGSGCGCH